MTDEIATIVRPWERHYDPALVAAVVRSPGEMLSAFQRHACEQPDAIALSYLGTPSSYAELDRQSDQLAHWFAAQGVAPHDRVAVALQNVPAFVIYTLAAWKVGAAICPVNPAYTSGELGKIFADAEPRIVLSDIRQIAAIARALEIAQSDAVLLTVDSADGQTLLEDDQFGTATLPLAAAWGLADAIAAGKGTTRWAAPDPDSLALLMYTSGTTGKPKGAMLTHRAIAWSANLFNQWMGHRQGAVVLAIAPLFHITGFAAQMAASLAAGATLLLPYRMLPGPVLELIRRERPTHTIGAITAFNALLGVPGVGPEDFTSFERVVSGGAPIPPSLRDRIQSELGLAIYPGYGMTETAAASHIAPFVETVPVDPRSGAMTIGIPFPGTDAIVVDEQERTVAPGEPGELLLRAPHLMTGYRNRPDETDEALAGGWMHTGDIVVMDEEGWFYVVDRKKDVIIASGFKVWPREVEDCLYRHPAVREAAVVGEADSYRGETVKAFVSLQAGGGVEPRELIAHCRAQLAPYKVPRLFEILDELPKTVTGKIQRNALRIPATVPCGRDGQA